MNRNEYLLDYFIMKVRVHRVILELSREKQNGVGRSGNNGMENNGTLPLTGNVSHCSPPKIALIVWRVWHSSLVLHLGVPSDHTAEANSGPTLLSIPDEPPEMHSLRAVSHSITHHVCASGGAWAFVRRLSRVFGSSG